MNHPQKDMKKVPFLTSSLDIYLPVFFLGVAYIYIFHNEGETYTFSLIHILRIMMIIVGVISIIHVSNIQKTYMYNIPV